MLRDIEQEAGLAYGSTLVNEGKLAQALTTYASIPTPQSAFNAAQVIYQERTSQILVPGWLITGYLLGPVGCFKILKHLKILQNLSEGIFIVEWGFHTCEFPQPPSSVKRLRSLVFQCAP